MNYVPGDLRDQLAHVGYDVVQAGLVCGSGGNLSARIPDEDAIWITASGTWLDRLSRPSFVPVDITDGEVVAIGNMPPPRIEPTSELALHLALYRARPDVNAVVHLHPQTALLLDALGEHIRIVTTDHAFYLRRVSTVPFRLPGTTELAALTAAMAADGTDCLVLSQHGCVVMGDSVELAHKRARNLEEAATLTYRALAAGRLENLRDCPEAFLDRLAGSAAVTV
ncbi:aldolase [Actinoplanes sp. SE50]|uniref:class II aldolase/adducin family protein n=1 Tax=unclassified Actinoplanes TaxID=2626549 RepID=UPI00023ED171|nr:MULTISPECIES: class II aldolase/adducin family protein [unclassified Actinoplanes]AEV81112.1 L-fuculose-phosphate aldolase [Actinoplanes sp. SE50/110]ATO79513.1 aldolase [Actinoplanes sp. SE50]SLL96914.1 class II aldolase [Actinoplanes sp. SE50/110]